MSDLRAAPTTRDQIHEALLSVGVWWADDTDGPLDVLVPLVDRLRAEAVADALRVVANVIEAKSSHAYDEDDEAYEDAARIIRDRADLVLADGHYNNEVTT